MDKTVFREEEIKQLGYYVYRLIDPRNAQTFYVGKGKGNRVFAHAHDAVAAPDSDDHGDKIGLIKEIHALGLYVGVVIHRHGMDEATAFHVESAVMDAYPGLTNIQGGHGGAENGSMHPVEIRRKYGLPPFPDDVTETLVLINLNQMALTVDRDYVAAQIALAWRINAHRANAADWILGVVRGVCVGAFCSGSWRPATRENFPSLAQDIDGRSGFDAVHAPPGIRERFVGSHGKRIVNPEMKHTQNPVLYFQPEILG